MVDFVTGPDGRTAPADDGANIVAGIDLNGARAQELRLSPREAGAVLKEMTERYRAREAAERGAATAAASGAARARLEQLKSDRDWTSKFLRGDIEARREFAELSAAVAAGSRTADAIAAPLPTQELETVGRGQLTSHQLNLEIAHLRGLGLNDDLIRQALDGQPVSAAERTMAVQMKKMLMEDGTWRAAFMKNNFVQRRQMLLLNLILSSEVAA
jgi:hypothetical protein